MKTKLAVAAVFAALSFLGSDAAIAQQPAQQPAPAEGQRPEHGMRGRGGPWGRKGGMAGFNRLDLSDAQREQMRAIADRYREATRTQREQMRAYHEQLRQGTLSTDDQARLKELRQQIRALEQQRQTEMVNVLTPEQKAKLDEMKQEFKKNHPRRFGPRNGAPEQQPQTQSQPQQ